MATRMSKTRYQSIAAINKMIDKFGHECSVIVSTTYPTPVPSKCLFTNYDLSLVSGSIAVNTNYKILLKSVTLEAVLEPNSKIIVNGAELAAITVKRLTPDGVNNIVWEIEAAGQVLPADPPMTITKPYIVFPTNLSENVTHTGTGSTCSLTLTGSVPTGMADDDSFASADWQISIENDFDTQVTVSTGNIANPVAWTTDAVLSEATAYFARVRYNTTKAKVSAWSDVVQFNLTESPSITVAKPTVIVAAADFAPISAYGNYMGYTATVQGSTPVITGDTFHHAIWQWWDNSWYSESAPYETGNITSATQEWQTIDGVGMVKSSTLTYHYRVKYVTSTGVVSEWSDWRQSNFTLVAA